MEVEKNWSELLMVMTEQDNGRILATEEKELMRMWIVEFFMKLTIFKDRLEKRAEEYRKAHNK